MTIFAFWTSSCWRLWRRREAAAAAGSMCKQKIPPLPLASQSISWGLDRRRRFLSPRGVSLKKKILVKNSNILFSFTLALLSIGGGGGRFSGGFAANMLLLLLSESLNRGNENMSILYSICKTQK